MTTDIVVCTYNRLPLLKRTLAHIGERTVTPYRLLVIDDGSTEGNVEYVKGLQARGQVARALLRKTHAGISANLRAIAGITTSDPVVFTDDDVLCPQLNPDWLAQGLEAMQRYPRLGLCALNNPHCNVGRKRGQTEPGDPVTFCCNVPGTFVFVRRLLLALAQPGDDARSSVKQMCFAAARLGWRVGYLTHVYCQHTGVLSARNNRDLRREIELVTPLNGDTLEPPDEYKG
jgi:glycosyltransferase involved in cell wall biosynthesis